MADAYRPTAEYAVRQYNINNDRMTYRALDCMFDFRLGKALAAHEARRKHEEGGGVPWLLPVSDLRRIAAEPGEGYGSQHTGPRNG